jgi:hypothetical protein
MGFKERMAEQKEKQAAKGPSWTEKLQEKQATKVAAKLDDTLENVSGSIYAESVSVPVAFGATGKHSILSDRVAMVEERGYRLDQVTSVYAEKVGQNSLIHTLIFRKV